MRYRFASLAVLVAAVVAAGCGGPQKGALEQSQRAQGVTGTTAQGTSSPKNVTSTTNTTAATAPVTTTGAKGGGASASVLAKGKSLFVSNCGGCHTLAAAGTAGTMGPNLDQLKPDEARVKHQIENAAPPMPKNLVSGADEDAVAKYVAASAGAH